MNVDRGVLYVEFVFLSVIIWVKATTITVDEDHCGGDISVDVNDSVFLNYYGADLKENASDKYLISEKKCIFKISASRSNYEICIRNKDQGRISVYQLSKCFSAFEYYMGSYGPYSVNQIYCIHFDDDPLCTTVDTVYAVYKYYSYVSYKEVWLEFEIFLRKPPAKREEPEETWSSGSSWSTSLSDSDTSDKSEEFSSLGLFLFLLIVVIGILFVCICLCKESCDKPYVSANTENTEPEGLRDNPFRNVQADGLSTSNVNRYRTEGPPAEASEDPWKPPEYESVMQLDQSFYGDSKPCKVYVSKETVSGPDNTEDLDDPPPPYPGV